MVYALAILLLVGAAQACNIPPGGCDVEKVCKKLNGLMGKVNQANFRSFPLMGHFSGLFSGNLKTVNQKGTGPVNYEYFQEVGQIVGTVAGSAGNTLAKCCEACAKKADCYMWHFFDSGASSKNPGVKDFKNGVQCYLLERNAGGGEFNTPWAGDKKVQDYARRIYKTPLSWVGGLCNGAPEIVNDPHLIGAQGTPFDFTGALDTSYCLLSDSRLHINILLRGYEGDAKAMAEAGDLSVHTWIKEIGLVWTTEDGSRHNLRLVARPGKSQLRGDGFLSLVELDGQAVESPKAVGDGIAGAGDVTLTKVAEKKEGVYDVDQFSVEIKGLATLSLRMRPAHPLLQTADDAQVHFNLQLTDVQTTPAVHGVLGQTFRPTADRVERAVKFSHLSSILGHPVAADKSEGAGFLDGAAADYASSSVVAPDCKFSQFA